MNIKLLVAVAILFGSLAAGLVVGSAPGLDGFDASGDNPLEVAMLECAGGYRADARGDCQPNNGLVDSRCPDGWEATPFPNGNNYKCVPIPTGY